MRAQQADGLIQLDLPLVQGLTNLLLNLLSNQIQRAVDAGAFDSVSPWHVANILWGSFNGITQLAITRAQLKVGTMDTDDLLSLCFDTIRHGLSAKIDHKQRA